MLATVKEASDELLIGAFTNGLKNEIRAKMHMLGTQSLLSLMELAQKVENRNEVIKKRKEPKKMALKSSIGPKWTGSLKPNFSGENQ